MQTAKTLLLIVDPQNDFCDPKGALSIPGADQDMVRLASMIQLNRAKIQSIQITFDSHHWTHIAHPYFWKNKDNLSPNPFTIIHLEDVKGPNPIWTARNPKFVDYAIEYVKKLTEQKKYALTIWPPHCILGTWGHNIYPELMNAIHYYEDSFAEINYVFKGYNPLTEHYSAIKAEIPCSEDPSTDVNKTLLAKINEAKQVIIAGEALSHCVASTVHDIFKYLDKQQASKFILLEDASSNIVGFEDFGNQFLDEMRNLKVKIAKTTDVF